jgi:hypothetical protein
MNLELFLTEYWWFLFWLLPLAYLYIRQRNKDTITGIKETDSQLFLEIGFILLVIFLIQKYIFTDHYYFLIALPITLLLYAILINYLLRGNDIYILESTIMNEKHYDIGNNKIHISPETGNRLLIMDKPVYDSKKHVGIVDYTWWRGSDKIKFCDRYLDEEGIFFHAELPQFKNVTVHMARLFLLKAKDDIGELIRENTMHTWLSPYKTAYQHSVMAENFPLHLIAIKNQYAYKPFTMPETLKELHNKQWLEAMETAISSELPFEKSMKEMEIKIETLIKEGGDSK